jgi:hypothetical protein
MKAGVVPLRTTGHEVPVFFIKKKKKKNTKKDREECINHSTRNQALQEEDKNV